MTVHISFDLIDQGVMDIRRQRVQMDAVLRAIVVIDRGKDIRLHQITVNAEIRSKPMCNRFRHSGGFSFRVPRGKLKGIRSHQGHLQESNLDCQQSPDDVNKQRLGTTLAPVCVHKEHGMRENLLIQSAVM